MLISLAPMEGLTGHVFRRVHAECFGRLDRYYAPFLAHPHVGQPFSKKAFKEIDPEANRGLNVIPQLLTNDAEQFVWAWLRSEVLEPKVIRFQSNNIYYEALKPELEKKEKEGMKNHD